MLREVFYRLDCGSVGCCRSEMACRKQTVLILARIGVRRCIYIRVALISVLRFGLIVELVYAIFGSIAIASCIYPGSSNGPVHGSAMPQRASYEAVHGLTGLKEGVS